VSAGPGSRRLGGRRAERNPQDRIRTLLLRGDNLLKSGRRERLPRALEAFEEAAALAEGPGIPGPARELVQRRIQAVRTIAADET
jgi:hypothetical protein